VTGPSSTAVVNSFLKGGMSKFLLPVFIILSITVLVWLWIPSQASPYIKTTLNTKGSIEKGNSLFRMNCVGCHGISAQGLVGPDLNDATKELSDVKIIKQVTQGLTPPMPSFEIDSQSMSDLLAYMHSLN
tara:strand:+ start:63933 stop:64322 length:390 start_codon:yes stop_codon:yes gene_type:complete